MSFFDKIYNITHTDLFKYVFHSGSDKVFVANVSKISTVNENVLDSKWTLTSHTLHQLPLMECTYLLTQLAVIVYTPHPR